MQLGADPGLALTIYTAQPDSPATTDGLALLASWTTRPDITPHRGASTPTRQFDAS